ncbi:MAG: hypothetical protein OEQ28_12945 [Acidobacteriota bacterium]|nr:hypothetical protein [Acidobacteriota bacterium]
MSDYLWDKSGSDPETELLENLLSEFGSSRQSRGSGCPVTPEDKRPFWRNRVFFAAVPAFGVILVAAFWFSFPTESNERIASAGIGSTRGEDKEAVRLGEPELVARKAIKMNVGRSKKIDRKQRIIKKSSVRKNTFRSARKKVTPPSTIVPPVLTSEEKEAYSQLIKALSITSSKLRMVKEKASGIEVPKGSE